MSFFYLNFMKITSFPEDILKLAREMDAEVHGKYQKSAAGKLTVSSGHSDILLILFSS